MEKEYILAKKIVSSKYSEDYEFYPLFVVSLTTLLYKYKDYQYIVERIFLDSDIFIEDNNIFDTLLKNGIGTDSNVVNDEYNNVRGISSIGYSFEYYQDFHFTRECGNSFIACNSNCDPIELLNTFIHEFNHLIKGYINNYYEQEYCYSIRSGLNYYKWLYDKETDIIYEYNYFSIIDEVINTIQTTGLMKNIKLLQIPDSDYCIKKYLGDIDKRFLECDRGYNLAVKAFRKIWDNDTFRSLIEDNIVEGNIEEIVTSFDNMLGEDSFNNFADLLDDLDDEDSLGHNGRKVSELNRKIRNIINNYNKKTGYKTFQKYNNVIEYRR